MRESALRPELDAAATDPRFPLLLMPFTYHVGGSAGQVSPLLTKLYQESGLRFTSDIAAVEPATAGVAGLEEGDFADVETPLGSHKLRVTIDSSVLPGVILVSVGPDPVAFTVDSLEFSQNCMSIVYPDACGAWTPTPVTIRKAS